MERNGGDARPAHPRLFRRRLRNRLQYGAARPSGTTETDERNFTQTVSPNLSLESTKQRQFTARLLIFTFPLHLNGYEEVIAAAFRSLTRCVPFCPDRHRQFL